MRRLLLIAAASLFVLLAAPFVGMQVISPAQALSPGLEGEIFRSLRLPRVLLAFLAGGALALAGGAFQALFRNPLATPYTLGVSAGAAFGAACALWLGAPGLAGIPSSAGAFAGALLAIALVWSLTRLRRGFTTASLLLAGVAASFFFGALLLFVQYLADFTGSVRITRWLMGSLEAVGYGGALTLLPFVLVGGALVLATHRELDLLALGEELALARGVEVGRVKGRLFLGVSLMVGGVVACCGPVGFVGMMAPHAVRLLAGPSHRLLLPGSFLAGGAFLVACDALGRAVIAPAEVPVGIITALLGGPFFVWLLVRGRQT